MAKYIITHKCDHNITVELYGKHEDRRRKIAAMESDDCPACRASGSDLVGSDRQIAWGREVQERLLPEVREFWKNNVENIFDKLPEQRQKMATAAYNRITCCKRADQWIDWRHHKDAEALFRAVMLSES